jgi:hypothetical protein
MLLLLACGANPGIIDFLPTSINSFKLAIINWNIIWLTRLVAVYIVWKVSMMVEASVKNLVTEIVNNHKAVHDRALLSN